MVRKFSSENDSGSQANRLTMASLLRRLMCTIQRMGSGVKTR